MLNVFGWFNYCTELPWRQYLFNMPMSSGSRGKNRKPRVETKVSGRGSCSYYETRIHLLRQWSSFGFYEKQLLQTWCRDCQKMLIQEKNSRKIIFFLTIFEVFSQFSSIFRQKFSKKNLYSLSTQSMRIFQQELIQ